MKKNYFSPCIRTMRLGGGTMMTVTSVAVGAKSTTLDAVEQESDIFWSKTFGGTIMDDVNSSNSSEE